MENSKIYDYVIRVARAMYLSNLKALDISIGRIYEALEDSGKLANTIIVYASDNGGAVENFQSTGKLRGYKGIPFEGGVRTFATISGPDIPGDTEYRGIFHITDWGQGFIFECTKHCFSLRIVKMTPKLVANTCNGDENT
jgi:arylsulfatase A-like enzyme